MRVFSSLSGRSLSSRGRRYGYQEPSNTERDLGYGSVDSFSRLVTRI